MCRWIAYSGTPVAPQRFLFEEQFSLIAQSQRARKSKSVVNGDGFGLGWYGTREEPGLFRDVLPAWSDENLKSLAAQISSPLFMAHVRAATDTQTTRSNCHPFRHGRCLFMHNGQIGGYPRVRRQLESRLPDEFYRHRCGTTDSEVLFLQLLAAGALEDFHGAIERVVVEVLQIMRAAGIDEPLRLTAAFTDGRTLHAVRYASDRFAPSLFYGATGHGTLVVSEPLSETPGRWRELPASHTLRVGAPHAIEVRPLAFAPAPSAASG